MADPRLPGLLVDHHFTAPLPAAAPLGDGTWILADNWGPRFVVTRIEPPAGQVPHPTSLSTGYPQRWARGFPHRREGWFRPLVDVVGGLGVVTVLQPAPRSGTLALTF